MFTPYNTDAPIYYIPLATIGLIIANVVVFGVVCVPAMASEEANGLMTMLSLDYSTINPLQWGTSIFLHGGIGHLIGNMFFLWGFGLVVEGKVGWKVFLPMYVVLGIATAAFEQVLFFVLGVEGSSLGASTAIFGILTIAVIWAPQNTLECVYFISVIPRTAEIPIVVFGGGYIALQVLLISVSGTAVTSALLHAMGIVLGIPIGLAMLQKEIVDCEGWDFVSIYFKGGPQKRDRASRRAQADAQEANESRAQTKKRRERLIESITDAIDQGNVEVAVQITLKSMDDFDSGKSLPDRVLVAIASALQKQKRWADAVPFLVEMIRRFPAHKTIPTRLKLAQILVQADERPRQAIAVLKKLPPNSPDSAKSKARQIAKIAKQQLDDGAIEVEIHDW
ncbi:MAG: rhomboid family intramembrane serine protease [Planctomycetales bacterium]|nr:rhomboid family intramembrane serine protease [Planctomycetales bacterium]